MSIKLIRRTIRNVAFYDRVLNMGSIRRILIDLSGTLHIDDTPTENSIESLNKLCDYDVQVRFITNTSKEGKSILHRRLTQMGYEINAHDIFSTLSAAELYIRQNQLRPLLLVAPESMEHFTDFLYPNEKPNAVVIGLAPTELYYNNMNEAFRCLMEGAKLIALNVGRYYKTSTGLSLGAGCFVKGLEFSTNTKAIVIGKPSPDFFRTVLEYDTPETTIMIGDDVIDDIKGAQDIGIQGYLVKTGKYLEGDERTLEKPPAGVCANFAEVIDSIIPMLKAKNY